MKELLANDALRVTEMTSHVVKLVYFVIKNNLSFRLFERLVNLCDLMGGLVGNFLHSRGTSELYRILDILFQPQNKSFLKFIQRINTIFEQWDLILEHPLLNDCLIVGVSLLPNSEAGCEQSISQLNRAKNEYSSLMSTEVLQARLRASTNGPPIHLLDTYALAHYWKANGHRLALKLDERADPDSKVITRTRKESEKQYTSTMFLNLKKYCPY